MCPLEGKKALQQSFKDFVCFARNLDFVNMVSNQRTQAEVKANAIAPSFPLAARHLPLSAVNPQAIFLEEKGWW
ncbi:hypothetical protein SUGI_0756600 [Cryptomeria japonica]|nr:hypothetical protein SUGI_0756600 [Cryptomeria japonica]